MAQIVDMASALEDRIKDMCALLGITNPLAMAGQSAQSMNQESFQPATGAATPQPPPQTQPGSQEVTPLVIEDLLARRRFGVNKYGTPLMADNGRNHLWDAYQEALDLVVYLRCQLEQDNRR